MPINVGELTYAFSKMAWEYLWRRTNRFATHAEIVAALECTKQEYYRRVLGRFEDEKIEVNGDVFE